MEFTKTETIEIELFPEQLRLLNQSAENTQTVADDPAELVRLLIAKHTETIEHLGEQFPESKLNRDLERSLHEIEDIIDQLSGGEGENTDEMVEHLQRTAEMLNKFTSTYPRF